MWAMKWLTAINGLCDADARPLAKLSPTSRAGISPRTLRYKLSQMRAAGIAIPED